jgi:hypothetical protein
MKDKGELFGKYIFFNSKKRGRLKKRALLFLIFPLFLNKKPLFHFFFGLKPFSPEKHLKPVHSGPIRFWGYGVYHAVRRTDGGFGTLIPATTDDGWGVLARPYPSVNKKS